MNAIGRQFETQGFRQGNDAGLGHVIAAHHRRMQQPGQGGDIDDMAVALALHHRHEHLAAAHYAFHVDIENPVPVGHVAAVNPGSTGHPGIVDQHIQPAPVLLQPFAGIIEAGGVAHIQILELQFAG